MSQYNNAGQNNADNNDSFKLDGGLIVNFLMLFIPGLRFFGAIWLYRRLKKQFRGKKSGSGWTLIPTLLFAFYALSEFSAGAYLWPLSLVALIAVAATMIFRSFSNKSDDVYAFLHGRDACYVSTLASALNMSDAQVMTCVRQLKRKGKLPQTTYIDKSRGLIVLTPNGRPAEDEVRQRSAPRPDKSTHPEPEIDTYDKILLQIRTLNDRIMDKTMSDKIYHIEATTASIFYVVKSKPEREKEIQSFLEYYLPATLKLLSRYAELEKQNNNNSMSIRNSMLNIEGAMDKVVEGFDTQLDKLYKSDAIDITNDINVLEKMMRMEGLNGK
ncbi:MAG: 5-bromo-4-chloroindolyl phosphate hydrolysis family protein [Clostridia bacterium]|nr:5-bromo-4-chloroindolyl phosphate hydrolysis family protein [Clostridia bacterium]MBR5986802.1 5-bromo-4-chloroindolyl phosphate hydrolysis family protein [Clostridia bacterium]